MTSVGLRGPCCRIGFGLAAPARARLLAEKIRRYERITDRETVVAYQVDAFNRSWKHAREKFGFYRRLAEHYRLPESIRSPADLEQFPPVTKEMIRSNRESITRDLSRFRPSVSWVSTGGSTGEPAWFPTDTAQRLTEYANTYLGRSWWGVSPCDRTILLWGHSHVFGAGIRGRAAQLRRRVYDYFVNTKRLNAYSLNPERLAAYCRAIARHRPRVLIGYTSAIFRVAEFARSEGATVSSPGLKAVILTAETATGTDIDRIQRVFNAPVVLEYGMGEAGPIAYSRGGTTHCVVFWDAFLCTHAQGELRLSTIARSGFPLINYSTLDRVLAPNGHHESVLEFQNVSGRLQEDLTVTSAEGASMLPLSGLLVMHVGKGWPHVLAVTSRQERPGTIEISVASDRRLDLSALKAYFLDCLGRECGRVLEGSVTLRQVSDVPRTIAGKSVVVSR